MEILMGFFIGVLAMMSVIALAYLSILVRLEWYTWSSLITGVIAVLFGIGWLWASFLEGYPQSGSLGLIVFSGAGVVMLVLTWRFLVGPALANRTNS
jgi:hypothetical protein